MFVARTATCRVVRFARPWDLGERHQAACLRCQAAAVARRNVERVLQEMRAEEEEAPAHIASGIASALSGYEPPEPVSRRKLLPAGAAGAAVMAAFSVVYYLWRKRALRTA